MTAELVLVARRADLEPLTRLAASLAGPIRVVEDRRVRTRDRRVVKRMMDHGRRAGKERRVALTGAFAVVGQAPMAPPPR